MANNADGKLPQPMVIAVRESLTRCYDNAFARMDTKRVKVLHVAHGDAIIRLISHHFVFYFLPAAEIFLHQNLRRISQGFFYSLLKISFVFAHARAQSSQRKGDSDHHRITNLPGGVLGLFQTPSCLRTWRVYADFTEPFHE